MFVWTKVDSNMALSIWKLGGVLCRQRERETLIGQVQNRRVIINCISFSSCLIWENLGSCNWLLLDFILLNTNVFPIYCGLGFKFAHIGCQCVRATSVWWPLRLMTFTISHFGHPSIHKRFGISAVLSHPQSFYSFYSL